MGSVYVGFVCMCVHVCVSKSSMCVFVSLCVCLVIIMVLQGCMYVLYVCLLEMGCYIDALPYCNIQNSDAGIDKKF